MNNIPHIILTAQYPLPFKIHFYNKSTFIQPHISTSPHNPDLTLHPLFDSHVVRAVAPIDRVMVRR